LLKFYIRQLRIIIRMRKIKGFDKAKPLLSRQAVLELSPLPSGTEEKTIPAKGQELSIEQVVGQIITEVRNRGDEALFDYTKKLDGADLRSLEVAPEEISLAYSQVDQKLLSALKLAADRISKFHFICKQQAEAGFFGYGLGQNIRPLDNVGVYVPGGTATYPSTVLMTAIPARMAGVNTINMTTPPNRDGSIPAPTLVAADIAKVNHIYKIGGAQAIAALAFGTESVPKVDKICGPGNIFVVTAKRMVYGAVDIDGLQGPSEIIIVADDTANASFCAADLIAQAEHDPLASAILITTSSKLANSVESEVKAQLATLERQTIAAEAINLMGLIVLVDSLDEAIELVNLYAPEHLSLTVQDANIYIQKIQNAGCIFIGSNSPVGLGDYLAGPSHVLPTGGSARFSSPLGIKEFLKITNIVALDEAASKEIGAAAITIAEAEGLKGHAKAIELRLQAIKEKPK